jgi:hypothetical protein
MARYMEKGEMIKFPMETFSLKSSDSWLKGVGALTCEARLHGTWRGVDTPIIGATGRYNWKRGYVENGGLSRHLSQAGSRLGYQVQPQWPGLY